MNRKWLLVPFLIVIGLGLHHFHVQQPSAEESALAPMIPTPLPASPMVSDLKNQMTDKRLTAIDRVGRAGSPGSSEIAALVRATQDSNPEVSRRAIEALAAICRSGRTTEVLRAYTQALKTKPHGVRVLYTGYYFKITRPDDENRAEQKFADAPALGPEIGAPPEVNP